MAVDNSYMYMCVSCRRSVYSDEGFEEGSLVEEEAGLSDLDGLSDVDPAEVSDAPLTGSIGYSDNFDVPEMPSDEEGADAPGKAPKTRRARSADGSAADDDSVNSDDLLAFLSDSEQGGSSDDGAPRAAGGRRLSVKERVDKILSPKVKSHAHVVRLEEDRSAARKMSVLDTDVGDFRSALIDALSAKPAKKVVPKPSPPKQLEKSVVAVRRNDFHSNLMHTEHVVRKQLATALKKIQVQSRENEVLLRRLDNSESLESFERLRRQLEEKEEQVEKLELDIRHLQFVRRTQEKVLIETSRDMHEENDPETSAVGEVRALTARLASMRSSLEDARNREKLAVRKYEQLRKKHRKLNKKHTKLKTDHSILSSREGSLFTIAESSDVNTALDGDSAFAASVDERDGAGGFPGSGSMIDMSVLEEEKSRWELEMKSVRKNAASQKSVYLSEVALLRSELQQSEKLRQDALDELTTREKQARVQVCAICL